MQTGKITKKTQDKNKTYIVIFDTCQYTTYGLSIICDNYADWELIGIVKNVTQLIDFLIKNNTDILICGVGTNPKDISALLHIPNYPSEKCILLTDNDTPSFYKTFIAAGFHAVISKNSPLKKLNDTIYETIIKTHSHDERKRNPLHYLPQERYVMSALLNGERPDSIANTLGISYRTVSRYKKSALKRAGLKKLNDILAFNKTIRPN